MEFLSIALQQILLLSVQLFSFMQHALANLYMPYISGTDVIRYPVLMTTFRTPSFCYIPFLSGTFFCTHIKLNCICFALPSPFPVRFVRHIIAKESIQFHCHYWQNYFFILYKNTLVFLPFLFFFLHIYPISKILHENSVYFSIIF